MDFDVIVIGAGPAGYIAAERVGQAGRTALLIEREEHLGGVCLNWGCIPTKTLLASAKVYYQATHGEAYGVHVEQASFQLEKAMARKSQVQNQLRQGIRGLMKKYGVEVVQGEAKIVAKDAVVVGDTTYRASNILVCTGSRPARPPIPGIDLPHVVDSNGFLELTELPARLVVIGGGVIGVEFACFAASVGVDVQVIEMAPEITPGIDTDVAKTLRQELSKKGVNFSLGARVSEITADGVRYVDAKGEQAQAAADCVLVCTGRVPNTEHLGLEACGVAVERGGIVIDSQCRTNVPGIYAAGDCTGKVMLAHVGSRQAEVAVNTMLGRRDTMRYQAIPAVIYTSPEVAAVGMTEAEAKRLGIPVDSAKMPLQANGRFLAEFEGRGLCKVVVHRDTRQVLGVHLIGASCSEIIHGAATMVETETRVQELAEIIFPHPTVSEVVRDTVFQLTTPIPVGAL